MRSQALFHKTPPELFLRKEDKDQEGDWREPPRVAAVGAQAPNPTPRQQKQQTLPRGTGEDPFLPPEEEEEQYPVMPNPKEDRKSSNFRKGRQNFCCGGEGWKQNPSAAGEASGNSLGSESHIRTEQV